MIFHLQAQGADEGGGILVSSDLGAVHTEGGFNSSAGISDVLYGVRIVGGVKAGRDSRIFCQLVQTERSFRLEISWNFY